MKAVPVAPPVNPHPMIVWAFQLPINRLTLLATSVSTLSLVPSSVHVSLIDLNWHHAMEEESAALIANNTWDLVPRPVGSNIVISKWIFMHKFNSNSSLEWYKAHWVLHDFTQWPGIDYDETFSSVVKAAMVYTLLSLAISLFRLVHHIDVKNVFMPGTLSEIVYYS
jgi:hypothetical protein